MELSSNTVIRIPVWSLTDTVLLPGCTMPLKGGENKLEYTKAFARVEYFDEEDTELATDANEEAGMTTDEATDETTPLASTGSLSAETTTDKKEIAAPDGDPESGFYPTLGVVSISVNDEGEIAYSSIGVTAEIISCALLSTDASFGMVVRGRQLFRVMKTEKIRNMLWATIAVFSDVPCCSISNSNLATISSWPRWAIKKYDPYTLLNQVIAAAHGVINAEKIPKDPEIASYYVISNLVMSDKAREELLELPTPIRLRKLIEVFDSYSTVCCAGCSMPVADTNEMFCMSNDMVQNAFVNKHGFVHDTITFRNLSCRPALWGSPTTKDSWYPGYSWTITYCSGCMNHLGWLFRSTKAELEPKTFWGLSRRSLKRQKKNEQ